MKRVLVSIFLVGCIFACTEDNQSELPSSPTPVVIDNFQSVGIRLNSPFATNQVNYQVRLQQAQTVTVKVVDILGKTVSTEKIEAKEGDNDLTLYTKALPRSSYQIKLYNSNNQQIGQTTINLL
jgi:hypothetical protein